MTNRLARESSPYLLQHAHNPVDWYPWGAEALSAAREQDKPILVSIGYAACHWCHVMERESFEDPAVAALMNEHFINIKIDREERPDLDHIYMDAVQALTGGGGWPLNVFLTPDARPFYGGTYYPPQPAYNLNSWTEVLRGVARAWRERKEDMVRQSLELTEHLSRSSEIGRKLPEQRERDEEVVVPARGAGFREDQLHLLAAELMKTADREEGGFGRAPKFPQMGSIGFLLRYGWIERKKGAKAVYLEGENRLLGEAALEQAFLSLDKLIAGGIYDQLGGGLARYSTDNEWLVPHFEKMLYDQALFVSGLADGLLAAGRDSERGQSYERALHHTLGFVRGDLLSPEGGFYSALHADSEGHEGKYYVWELGEVKEVLGEEDARLAAAWYGITAEGNWEGINILTRKMRVEELSEAMGAGLDETLTKIDSIGGRLLERRGDRIRPALDDKQLLGWNALMNTALCKAAGATGDRAYRELAIRNMEWMLRVFADGEGQYHHTYKDGVAKFPAFLDDLAYLVQALIQLQELTGDTRYIERAGAITERIVERFGSEDNHLFYYTGEGQEDVVVRKREVYDGAQPSGNAVMQYNLNWLGVVLDRGDWKQRSMEMLESLSGAVTRYPGAFGHWAIGLLEAVKGCAEIVVAGPEADDVRNKILANFIPFRIIQSTTRENEVYPLLRHKLNNPYTRIHVCRNYTCARPVATVEEALTQIG